MFANAMDKPQGMQNSCVYCDFSNHRSLDCRKVINVAQWREVLKKKRLCFNCTGFGHGASKCRSRGCRKCNGRHHTSLCDATIGGSEGPKQEQPEMGKRAIHLSTTLHATLVAKVNGIPARIMVDSGASSSYICTNLLTKLGLKPVSWETRHIEQMFGTVQRRVQIFKVTIQSNAVDGFRLDLKCINGEKDMLTHLPNPRIKDLKKKYNRFRCLKFSDEDTEEDKLPIHIILGAADYQRIKTTEPPVLGPNPDVDPGAEFTMLGWTLTGKTVEVEHQKLCAFSRIRPFLNREKAIILLKSIVMSNFSYCPLIWMFCSKFANKEINRTNKRALRVSYEDYDSSFEQLIEKDGSITVHQKNLQILMTEIYKTTNHINPPYIWDFFVEKDMPYNLRNKVLCTLPQVHTNRYGLNSLSFRGSILWNNLKDEIKRASTLTNFKKLITKWDGKVCNCLICK